MSVAPSKRQPEPADVVPVAGTSRTAVVTSAHHGFIVSLYHSYTPSSTAPRERSRGWNLGAAILMPASCQRGDRRPREAHERSDTVFKEAREHALVYDADLVTSSYLDPALGHRRAARAPRNAEPVKRLEEGPSAFPRIRFSHKPEWPGS